jgi:hypothetical protein
MRLYSDYSGARARQIFSDVAGLISIALIAAIAGTVTASVRAFGVLGRELEVAGRDFQSGLTDAADTLGDVPLLGSGIRGPFDMAAGAGESVAAAGAAQQASIEAIAVGAGASLAFLLTAIVALLWLTPRIRFVRRSAQIRGLLANGMTADTLAMRAVARAPLAQLLAVHPDPAGAWQANDRVAIRGLAGIELRRAGVRVDALP